MFFYDLLTIKKAIYKVVTTTVPTINIITEKPAFSKFLKLSFSSSSLNIDLLVYTYLGPLFWLLLLRVV